MAINSSVSLTAFVLVALVLCLPFPSGAVPSEELERVVSVLRVRGRSLFANAVTTSDILFDLLSAESLTLLVPTDAMLFNLDMTHSLPLYISILRLHALPLRLPISELQSLPNASSVPTFLPSHSLLLTKHSSSGSVYLDGVRLLTPGLFYDQNIAVHGIANILSLSGSHGTDLENRSIALPPMVYSPANSPSPKSTWWFSPSAEDYIDFFGRAPAEPPRIREVSVSPSGSEEDLIVGDGDSWTTEF